MHKQVRGLKNSTENASHDNLYHSLLGLVSVRSERYRSEPDLFSGCRGDARAAKPQIATLDRSASS